MTTLVLEFDDFHPDPHNDCLAVFEAMAESWPSIKISAFTVPCLNKKSLALDEFEDWRRKVRKLIEKGNLRLAVHGFYHTQEEFKDLDMVSAHTLLSVANLTFDKADLPVTKVFRGPHWGLCDETIHALVTEGFTHVYTHETYSHLDYTGITPIYYNWNLKDEAPENEDLLITHGHTHKTCDNGIEEVKWKVMKYIQENKPEFLFVDEVQRTL